MIDTHSHINMIEGLTLEEIIKEAKDNGVEKIILPAASLSDIDTVYEIADKYEGVYGLLGIHPSEVQDWTDELIDKIKEYSKIKKLSESERSVSIIIGIKASTIGKKKFSSNK